MFEETPTTDELKRSLRRWQEYQIDLSKPELIVRSLERIFGYHKYEHGSFKAWEDDVYLHEITDPSRTAYIHSWIMADVAIKKIQR
jgi:hypothetical protein